MNQICFIAVDKSLTVERVSPGEALLILSKGHSEAIVYREELDVVSVSKGNAYVSDGYLLIRRDDM
jgi:hypothetical protein